MTKQDKSHSRRKTIPVWLIVLLVVCLSLTITCIVYMFFKPSSTRAPQQFPDTDIVFSTENELGFMDSDGTVVAIIPFMLKIPNGMYVEVWGQPLITRDGKYLIVTRGGFPLDRGDIYIAHAGEFAILCEQWQVGFVRLAADQEHILFDASATQQGLAKYSPEDCGTDNSPAQVYTGVVGSLSPDEQYSAEVVWNAEYSHFDIVIHQISSGNERIIGPGDWPVWSRDSQWLAYTGEDGIYVVNATEDAQPRRLVSLRNPDLSFPNKPLYNSNYSGDWVFSPPMVSWSPDGQWLVYHMLGDDLGETAGYLAKNYSIYKVNISTGEVIKLFDGGMYPYWRWMARP